MTDPSTADRREWWTRPATVLPVVASIALLVAFLTPQAAQGRFGDSRLSTHLAGAQGARLLADLSKRLGWTVIQRDSQPSPEAADARTIHAVLAPPLPATAEEAHQFLTAVRGGDALLLVVDGRSPLSDSLGVTNFRRGGLLPRRAGAGAECAKYTESVPPVWPDGRVHLYGLRWLRGVPRGNVVFATLSPDETGSTAPGDAAVGFAYGNGRVVVVADPDLMRNDVLRHCGWGTDVITVRILEWLRAGGDAPRTTLAFDEYHQGYGAKPSVFDVTGSFLVDHPAGRAILQLALAALVLLFAVAPRALPPVHVEAIERRDPLEQVDALAHAYEQVHATKTLAARLLRGVRWRVERGGSVARARADDAFLNDALARAPSLGDDVARVRHALAATIPDRDLPALGEALRRIEHTLTTTIS
ncbi:MAG: DUF4350 domain-containing protein [Gemmatimonadota bacterium]